MIEEQTGSQIVECQWRVTRKTLETVDIFVDKNVMDLMEEKLNKKEEMWVMETKWDNINTKEKKIRKNQDLIKKHKSYETHMHKEIWIENQKKKIKEERN